MKVKKIISGVISAAMVFCVTAMPTFATDMSTLKDGKYTANITMKKDNEQADSMCASFFAAKADININGDNATITSYVVNPVPAFPPESSGNYKEVLKDVKATVSGTEYVATIGSDFVNKEFDKTGMSGVKVGETYPCNAISITVPKAALSQEHIDLVAFVNVVMKTNVDFDMVLSNITSTGSTAPSVEETTKDVTVTATVAASKADYNVTIPESISFGELSTKQNTVKNFDVVVNMTGGNDGGKVKVIAEGSGNLVSGTEKIAFSNDFGTKEFTGTTTQSGSLTVLSNDVKNAKPGNYTGTTTFTINYAAK